MTAAAKLIDSMWWRAEYSTGFHEGKEQVSGRSFYASLGRLSAIIFILPASMAAGWLIGFFVIDHYLGTFPWGTLLFVFLGAGAGSYEIVRIVMLDRNDRA